MTTTHERHMQRCIVLAREAAATGDARVGSLVVRGDEVIGEGVESVRRRGDVTAHAEIEAVRAALAHAQSLDLSGCTLYTSVEPCMMCAYAIRLARIDSVVSGARSSGPDTMSGHMVLTDGALVPGRPVPVVIRDVLAPDCAAARDGC